MGTDTQTDKHRSEYNSPSTVPFFITIVIIKEGRTKKDFLVLCEYYK
jgi:hypothetical protein